MSGLPAAASVDRRLLPRTTFAGRSAVVLGANGDADRAVIRALEDAGASVHATPLASFDAARAGHLLDAAEAGGAPVDALYVSAYAQSPTPSEASTPIARADALRHVDVAAAAATELARRRLADGRGASIVFAIDATAWTGGPERALAAAAHGALLSLAKSLGSEWAGRDIRVNTLAIGPFVGTANVPTDLSARLPAMRLGAPHELGWAAAFLLSPYAAYVTGAEFTIDGGAWLRRRLLEPERAR